MTWIGKFAQGDWAGGLAGMFGAGTILDAARGDATVGDVLKEKGIEAATTVATAGIGAAAGAGASALAKAAQAGASMSKTALVGTKIAAGAGKVLTGVSKLAGGGSLLNKGTATGQGANLSTEGVKGVLPDLDAAMTNLKPTGSLADKIGAKLPGQSTTTATGIPGNNIQYTNTALPTGQGPSYSATFGKTTLTAPGAGVTSSQATVGSKIAGAIKNNKGVIAQYGIQGALSLASGIQASKQARAANAVSQQGLLFQQQTYAEQKAEKEKYKTGMKEAATTAYESTQLFGAKLQEGTPSSNLLTSYAANGSTGDFSLLSSGITTSKKSDLT